MSETSDCIVFSDAAIKRGDHIIWQHGTFAIPTGSVTAIVGTNGTGKTTMMRAELGLLPLCHGSLTVLGKPAGEMNKRIGYVPQSYVANVDSNLTAEQSVLLGLTGTRFGIHPITKAQKAKALEAMEFTGTSALKRGDVLLTNTKSHTVIWLGNNRIVGAEGDWDGKPGDGSGNEVTERSYYAYNWQWVLRWRGGIAEDGLWGEGTTLATQELLGMKYKDGEVSRQDASTRGRMPGCTTGWEWLDEPGSGSPLIRELQRIWGAEQTGVMDVDTINAMIGYYMKKGSGATKRDGKLDRNSPTIKQFQHEVNNGRV